MTWEDIHRRLAADSNDAQAWEALEHRVRRWARAAFWSPTHHLIEDVVADTCAAVALALGGARGAETFAGFAYGHFLNARRRVLHDNYGPPDTQPLGDFDVVAPLESEARLDADERARLRRAIASLPPRERAAVVLRYFEDCPSSAVADHLGVSTGYARRILFNGLRRLRAELGTREDWFAKAAPAAE